jgi:hypothetical protein
VNNVLQALHPHRIKRNAMTTQSVLYKIDGGIDFYKELLESDASNSNSNSTNDDEGVKCLLTNQPLAYGHITLPCGHKFNFLPLYTETLYQKTNPSFVKNVYNVPIGKDKLKCPYCRTVHVGALLPYIVNEKRVTGVNAPVKLCMPTPFKCQHVSVSATQKRRTPCRSFVNVYCIPATDTGDPVFLCKRHLTLTRAKQLQ